MTGKHMKVLYLTMDGFDTAGPNNQMAMVMIREFTKHGYQVHLIQSRRTRKYPEVPDMLKGLDGLEIETVDRKVIDKSNFVIRYLDEVKWAFQSMAHWKNVKDADVVFLQSCPTAFVQLLLLKLLCRKPVIFNIYDMWPGHAMDLGVMNSKFLYNCFRLLQKIAYALSTKIAVLSEDMRDKLMAEGVKKDKIVIVPAWYDDAVAMEIPRSENRFLKKYNLNPTDFVVQFAGTIGYVFNYKLVLDTAELMKNDTGIRFQMIGDGLFKKTFVEEAQARGLNNIDFYPLQPVDIVPDVYSACDIEIIPLRKGVIGNGVPSKAPLLMACHKTIVNSVEEDSAYYHLFNDNKMGISVPLNDAKALAEAIRMLAADQELCRKMADRAKAYSQKHYSASVCTKKFMNAFDEMARKC